MNVTTKNVIKWTKEFFKKTNCQKAVVGISGGKDSTVVAAICAEALGKENVIGVTLPNGCQKDIEDSYEVIRYLGIKHQEVNIKNVIDDISLRIPGFLNSEVAVTNLPARIRMSVLYAVAQTNNAMVANTCNLSEDTVGYATLFGDSCGSFSPVSKLTTEEIMEIGDDLELPKHLVHKTPIDGLQPLSDEDKLGFTYHEVNEYIRHGIKGEHFEKILKMYNANKFKTEIIQIPAFDPEYDNYFLK